MDILLHSAGAIGALATGVLALIFPNGTARHRLAGKLYLLFWSMLAIGGALVGMRRPGVSVFEIINMLGFASVLAAYSMVVFRRRMGRIWLRRHYNWMVTSLTFLVVGTVQVLLRHTFSELPTWVFYLSFVAPAPVVNWYIRRLDLRYGFAKAPAQPARQQRSPEGVQ